MNSKFEYYVNNIIKIFLVKRITYNNSPRTEEFNLVPQYSNVYRITFQVLSFFSYNILYNIYICETHECR